MFGFDSKYKELRMRARNLRENIGDIPLNEFTVREFGMIRKVMGWHDKPYMLREEDIVPLEKKLEERNARIRGK